MKALSGTGIAISLVSGFLLLALLAELYYLLCWKKKKSGSKRILHHHPPEQEEEEEEVATATSPAKELLYLFCWKKPSSLGSSTTTTALNPCEIYCSSRSSRGDNNFVASDRSEDLRIQLGEETSIDAELMRLHSLSGPPRFLFTIKEETKEDLESEDGRSRKSVSTGRSLSELLATTTETPYLTPISSPPFFTPCNSRGINPLFESFKNDNELSTMRSPPPPPPPPLSSTSSPLPKFKFLRDAEEKLYRKILTEEAWRVHRSSGSPAASPPPTTTRGSEDHEDGSFITIIISKGQQQHPTPSQVNPLPSPPPSITITRPAAEQGKPVAYFGTNV